MRLSVEEMKLHTLQEALHFHYIALIFFHLMYVPFPVSCSVCCMVCVLLCMAFVKYVFCFCCQVFCTSFDVHLDQHVWIAILLVPVIVLSWIRNLEELSPFSLIANVCILFSVCNSLRCDKFFHVSSLCKNFVIVFNSEVAMAEVEFSEL